jgi:hypothetical protein
MIKMANQSFIDLGNRVASSYQRWKVNPRMRELLLILFCGLCTANQADEVRIWAEATINNQPVRLAFDTGAPDLCLFRRTAERLKLKLVQLPPEDRPPAGTVFSGEKTEPVELSLGSTKDRTEFFIMNDPPEQAPTEIEGLLSWNRMKSRVFVFDPAGPNVSLVASLPDRARQWPKFKLRPDAVVLGFESGLDDPRHHTIYVDTGAPYGVALNHELWTKWLAAHTNQAATISASFSGMAGVGTVILTEMWADEIDLGSLHLTEVPVHEMTAREEGSPVWPQPAAVLGLSAVGRLDLVVDGQTATVYARQADGPARA